MRPLDWAPLAEADPLPGDPDEISYEAARLTGLGADMHSQAARLRLIGADATLVGAYAQELRSASSDLAGDLEKVAGRYDRVGSALSEWAPKLADAQADTLKARFKALAADDLRRQNTPLDAEPNWGQTLGAALTDPALASRLAGQSEAEAMLAEARRLLTGALEDADTWGRYYGHLIDDANEVFKDGRWDNLKDWVDRNAEWIESYTDNLGWIATAAAVGAIFLPGANILVLTAMGITALSATTHATLLATGNGSWTDLGLDVFALATFGAGAAAARGLKSAQLAARTAAAGAEEQAAIRTALRGSARARTAALWGANPPAVRAALPPQAVAAGERAAGAVLRAPLPQVSRLEALVVGEAGPAQHFKAVLAFQAQHPAAPGMQGAVRDAAIYYSAVQGSFTAGTSVDAYGKADDVGRASRRLWARTGSSWS